MSREVVRPGTHVAQTGSYGDNPFHNPRVRDRITRLKVKVMNLEDMGKGSIVHNDTYKYLIKPLFKDAVASNHSKLAPLFAGGPTVVRNKQEIHYGSSQYTWFMNAAASRMVDYYILYHAGEIFGSSNSKYGAQVVAGLSRYRGKDGAPGYLKKKWAGLIKTHWIYKRLEMMQKFGQMKIDENIMDMPMVAQDYETAMAAKQGGKTVQEYRGPGARSKPTFNAAQLAQYMDHANSSSISSSSSQP